MKEKKLPVAQMNIIEITRPAHYVETVILGAKQDSFHVIIMKKKIFNIRRCNLQLIKLSYDGSVASEAQ